MYVLRPCLVRKFSRWSMAVALISLFVFGGTRLGGRVPITYAAEQAAPDLIITSIKLDPPNPVAGQESDIIVTVKNQGDAATATAYKVNLYVNPATEPPTQATPFTAQTTYGLALPPGGEFIWTRTKHQFTASNPKIYAWVDPENKVAESNEDNNLYPQTSTGSGDAYEKDDRCEEAKVLTTDGVEQVRNLFRQPGPDEDWVKFTATGGVTYYAEAIAAGADADMKLELHAACDGPPSFSGAKLTFTPPADGTYYLKAGHNQADYGPDNGYRLKMSSDNGCTGFFEVNNSCVASSDLALSATQTHSFCEPNDVDWSHFQVQAGVKYKVTTTNVGAKADVRMSLFENCSNATSVASGETIEFTANTSGFAYVKTVNSDPNNHGADTEYTVSATQVGGASCPEDGFEQDDNQDAAKSVTVDSAAQTRNTCPADDVDWVKFEATAGVTYTLESFNLASASDTRLCLLTGAGETIACDDDSGAGKGSRVSWMANANGIYFVRITQNDAEVAGANTQYDLQIIQGYCKPDANEGNNSLETARTVTPDNSLSQHNICAVGDEDWVLFNAAANTSYTIETAENGPEADTVLELYDANKRLLAKNDDYTPGTASQLVHTVSSAGAYYVRVQLYNPTHFGIGTEYGLRIRPGAVNPTPTPTVTPMPTPTATPPPQVSGVRTLILVNRSRLAALYNDTEADQVMAKLDALARHDLVKGEVVRLENNSAVRTAYDAWVADPTNVDKANQVAAAIRNVVLTRMAEATGLEYVVLVGDDRALPFRRVPDNTPQSSEKTYKYTDANHPTGAAQRANYFLTDDYFVDREPTPFNNRELYLPDLAVGRLIETPQEIMGMIDSFLAAPTTSVNASQVLVSGYDFVQDLAQEDCADWQTDLGGQAACSLIGDNWTGQAFRDLQLRTTNPFKIQSISGHAAHFAEGAPDNSTIRAHEIANTQFDLSGGLIYTPGCHSGLNVPPTNSTSPMDLAQAFLGKRANYVGNTGYGWGLHFGIGLSEKLIRLYTRELLKGGQANMGKALMTAKQNYYQQGQDLSAYDEKILEELTFYGLPMRQLQTGAALSIDEFPGVETDIRLPGASLGDEVLVVTGTAKLGFQSALGINIPVNTGDGIYYALDGFSHAVPGQPIQPLYYKDVSVPNLPARSVLLLSGNYHTQASFDPVIAAPDNEYVTVTVETSLANPLGFYPPVPVALQTLGNQSMVNAQVGQYDAERRQLRIFDQLETILYYSTSADQTAPQVTVVDGVARGSLVEVKVGVWDASGIERVVVSYIKDVTQKTGSIASLDLQFNPATQKWQGFFPGDANSRYFVQVIDKAGNKTDLTNKQQYYAPGQLRLGAGCNGLCVFLPAIAR